MSIIDYSKIGVRQLSYRLGPHIVVIISFNTTNSIVI